MEEVFKIEGRHPLKGEVRISGAKNATVALIPASILAGGPVTICGVPKANLTCEGNVFTGNVAENALTDYNIIWIQNGRLTTIQSLLFDGFEIRK